MSNNAHDLSKRLLNALDNSYNVVDMHAVNEIISILERFNITKELLETTRLGKHVNELRRKTKDPSLARRAKVLVKRWRDLVIPGATSSPAHTGVPVPNRSSAERTRRLGGTPLTSPALARQVVSPAVNSPRPTARPAWGGYESDSQDVIVVVDDDPPPPLAAPPQHNATSKRPLSPAALQPDEKKAKRDKKPKKKRGHSRAGSGSEAPAEGWSPRNGASPPAPAPAAAAPAPAPPPPHATSARKNGCRKPTDAYSQMVNRMPAAGAKKVKTTKELLEEIQSRGTKQPEPASPGSPDIVLIEPDPVPVVSTDSPLRNGTVPSPSFLPREASPPPPEPLPPLEDPREYVECTCGEEEDPMCRAAVQQSEVTPLHVLALHHAFLPGVNGTRAPPKPHRYAVRPATDPDKPGLFTSVVPLYKYTDYADDYCVKNMSRVPLCPHLPWTEFAPDPPELPPPPPPNELRPYPIEPPEIKKEVEDDDSSEENSRSILIGMETDVEEEIARFECPKIEPEMVSVPALKPSDRLRPRLFDEEDANVGQVKIEVSVAKDVKEEQDIVPTEFKTEQQEHRTVERTKEKEKPPEFDCDGRTLCALCEDTKSAIPFDYEQVSATPVVTLPLDIVEATDVLESSLIEVVENTERDELGRPVRPTNFTEWHECAQLGDLIALPYVVID